MNYFYHIYYSFSGVQRDFPPLPPQAADPPPLLSHQEDEEDVLHQEVLGLKHNMVNELVDFP